MHGTVPYTEELPRAVPSHPNQALCSVIHMQLQAPMRRLLSLRASGSSSLFLASSRVLGNFHQGLA